MGRVTDRVSSTSRVLPRGKENGKVEKCVLGSPIDSPTSSDLVQVPFDLRGPRSSVWECVPT